MKTAGWFKRFVAGVCVAALLTTGAAAFAASPADTVTQAELSMTNAYTVGQVYDLINQIGTVNRSRRPQIVAALNAYNTLSDAQKAQVSNFSVLAEAQQVLGIQDALANLSVKRNSADTGWFVRSYYEATSLSQKACAALPYLYVSDDATEVLFQLQFQYVGDSQMDLYQVIVRAGSKKYTFHCDTDYGGGYNTNLGWFDFENFTMEPDELSWFGQWLSQSEVIMRFTGWDGSSVDCTLTPENRQALTDLINVYNLIMAASPDVRLKAIRNL